jgi:ATP-dependent protease ClpP protease subunit
MNTKWSTNASTTKNSKKRKTRSNDSESDDDASSDAGGGGGGGIESLFKVSGQCTYILNNHIHFNDDVTQQSMFKLSKELRSLAQSLKLRALALGSPLQPIYLHMTTNGGEINAAWSVVDCINGLGVPVYSVVDGFVASAGTLITLAAEKRFIQPNAYMLIHQLSSGVWGKMSAIDEQVANLKKLMTHITKFYLERTRMSSKALHKMLVTDVTWNAEESITKGIVDEIYDASK